MGVRSVEPCHVDFPRLRNAKLIDRRCRTDCKSISDRSAAMLARPMMDNRPFAPRP